MATDDEPALARDTDLDVYAICADIPDGLAVLLVTEVDLHDGVFAGRWTTDADVARVSDGEIYIRLRRIDPVYVLVDAELVLAHDGHLMTVMRLHGVRDWADELRLPAAAIRSLHTDIEAGEPCRAYAESTAPR